jgi:ADP-heptose:LPS heptosyltransferase
MKIIDYSKIEKIIILRIGKIGDIILSSFVFSILKKSNPKITIELITLKKNKDVLRSNPNISKIYFVNKNFLSLFKLLPLKLKKYDLVIDLNDNPSTTSAFLLKLINAREKLGFNFSKQKKYLSVIIDQPDKEKTHIIERYSHLLRASGLNFSDELVKAEMFLDNKIEEEIKNQFEEFKKNYRLVGINISAGAEIRKYPSEKWIETIKILSDKYPRLKFIILFDLKDKRDAEKIFNSLNKNLFVFTKGNSFQHFAARIKNLNLLITPDTSAVHIASAFQIPVIALFPNVKWNFVSFAPYKTSNKIIMAESERIEQIPVEKIIYAFDELTKELGWNYD